MTCGKCKVNECAEGRGYCKQCQAAYMRDYRRIQRNRIISRVRRDCAAVLEQVGEWNAADIIRGLRVD